MKHIAGWFRRNNTIMAQAKDLSRQLHEAWEDASCQRMLKEVSEESNMYLHKQLHRVARERDNERKLRLDLEKHYEEQIAEERGKRQRAESALLDKCLKQAAEEMVDIYLAEAPNEEE